MAIFGERGRVRRGRTGDDHAVVNAVRGLCGDVASQSEDDVLAAPVRKGCSEHVPEAAEPGGAVELHHEHGAVAVDDEGGEAVVLAVHQSEACHAGVSEESPSTPVGCFEPFGPERLIDAGLRGGEHPNADR